MAYRMLNLPKNYIRKIHIEYKTNPEIVQDQINTLSLWIQQQAHFPKYTDRDFLEGLLVRNAFNVECVKIALDNYFTLRRVYKMYFGPSNEHFEPSTECFVVLPLPQITDGNERIIFLKLKQPQLGLYNFDRSVAQFVLTCEYLIRHDYIKNILFVMDCANFSLNYIRQLTVSQFSAAFDLLQRVYSSHLTGIIYFNAPTYWVIALELLKKVTNANTFNNIVLVKGVDGIYERTLTRNCMPKEYGGYLAPMDILLKQWHRIFKENVPIFDSLYHMVTDESKRIPSSIHSEEWTESEQEIYLKLQNYL